MELGEKQLYYTPRPYFIVLASSVTTMEVKAIEFHRIVDISALRVRISFHVRLLHSFSSLDEGRPSEMFPCVRFSRWPNAGAFEINEMNQALGHLCAHIG